MSNFNEETELYPQKLQWRSLEDHSKESSSIFLMLSELIDNAIESFEKFGQQRIKKGEELYIKIIFDKVNNEYIIEDNACGIQDLNYAMTLYKGPKSKDSKSNYGIGLKNAIFWLGKDGEIYTKCEGKGEKNGCFIREEGSDNVMNKIINCNGNINWNSGTKIIIKDARQKRRLSSDDKVEKVINSLGYRYYHYLTKVNNLKLNLKLIIEDDDKTTNKDVEAKTLFDNKKHLFKLEDKIPELRKRKEYTDYHIDKIEKYPHLKQYFEMFLDNKPIIVEDKLEMITENGKIYIPMKVAILNSPDKHKCGVSILQSNRYINHPAESNQEEHRIGNYSWSSNDRFKDGHYKWLIAEIDIAKIPGNENCDSIYPDKNKSSIKFDENQILYSESNFKKSLESFINKIDPLINLLIELNDEKSKNKKISITRNLSEEEGRIGVFLQETKDEDTLSFNENFISELSKIIDKRILIKFIECDNDEMGLFKRVDSGDNDQYIYEFNLKNEYFTLPTDDYELKMAMAALLALLEISRQEQKEDISITDSIDKVLTALRKYKKNK